MQDIYFPIHSGNEETAEIHCPFTYEELLAHNGPKI